MPDWDDSYDIVCVGSGAGGLAAAVVAAERGARVLVVEKDDKLGGVTALTGGQIWVAPNPLQPQGDAADRSRTPWPIWIFFQRGWAASRIAAPMSSAAARRSRI
ncbi:FAD-dependent oxidoreductase [Rhizorhabdus histidinilytica]